MEVPLDNGDLDNEDKALKSLFNTFGSAFSLEEIASAFGKAGRDATLVSGILSGLQRGPSSDPTFVSKESIDCEIPSKVLNNNGYDKPCYANRNNFKASVSKRNPASVRSNSRVVGKNYVWRVAGSNNSINETKPVKVEATPVATNSCIPGEACVWRIAQVNRTANGTTPFKVEANNLSVPVNTSDRSSSVTDVSLSSSERSSSPSNVGLNDDIENFLFEMLGRGCQLERNTIRDVLGDCGYDMRKSLETLLDLTAVTLDRRNDMCEGIMHSNSRSLSSEILVQNLYSVKRKGSRTMRTDIREGMTEPLKNIAEDCEAKTTIRHLNMKDEAEEGSYFNLRKAVKEHRETMKEYYKAAEEAYARGDHGQAKLLLEKGQFFHNKAREADEESVQKIFETSGDGEMQEEMSIDLQDHDASEAIRLIKIHLRTLSGIPLVKELKLIIGNDGQYAEKRKRLILKLLKKEAIKWTEDENSKTILIRLDEINPRSLSFGKK